MPESGPYGSVRGALSNERPYRDPETSAKLPVFDEKRAALLRKAGYSDKQIRLKSHATW
jgi:hypothetical protein